MRMSHFEDESSEQKYSLLFLTYDIFSLQFPNVLSLLKPRGEEGLFYGSDCSYEFFSACLRPLRPLKIVAVFRCACQKVVLKNGSHRFSIGLICVKER